MSFHGLVWFLLKVVLIDKWLLPPGWRFREILAMFGIFVRSCSPCSNYFAFCLALFPWAVGSSGCFWAPAALRTEEVYFQCRHVKRNESESTGSVWMPSEKPKPVLQLCELPWYFKCWYWHLGCKIFWFLIWLIEVCRTDPGYLPGASPLYWGFPAGMKNHQPFCTKYKPLSEDGFWGKMFFLHLPNIAEEVVCGFLSSDSLRYGDVSALGK